MPEQPAQPPVLEALGCHKRYRLGSHDVPALAGVDLTISRGDFVAIMGPSGSGKSTLLHLMGGLDRPSEGEIILDNQPLSPLSDDQITLLRRHKIGFIFQFFNLLPMLTAEENILLPVIIDNQDSSQYRNRLDALLKLVGLGDRRDHKPDQLSGGEQQRVAIARALITNPVIVLADEPTGNLDTKAGAAIMRLLVRTQQELGQTSVIVTHDPRAAAYAGRLVLLRDGLITTEVRFTPGSDTAHKQKMIIEAMEALDS